MNSVILERFESPDETRRIAKGEFETVTLGGMNLGRGTYEPGWKGSEHVERETGASVCSVEHVGRVLNGTGTATAAFDDGTVTELRGKRFYIPPVPHDSSVVGDEPCVSLHFLGADTYAKGRTG